MIVGLTGSSGSGKSTVAQIFKKNGFEHIDCDALSRNVTAAGSECLIEITSAFGCDILTPDGSLNRRGLGEIVFRDTQKLELLNNITHKYILRAIDGIIALAEGDVLIDAPLLFEANLDKRCDITVGVIADRNAQIKRIAMRDGISEETASERIGKQHDNEFFIKNCDYCIENTATEEQLEKNTQSLILKLKSERKD